ncbi:MAG: two-component sensor histidine kinase [Caulobacteraceae bacterium]|nr:two-component sensor histidine kinase [Caulobacteraceae bacterium]
MVQLGATAKKRGVGPFVSRLFWPRLVKRWLPASLFGRTLLIFALPVAIMQIGVGWVFFDNHWRQETDRLSDSLAGEIVWIAQAYEADPTPANLDQLAGRARRTLSLSVTVEPGRFLPPPRPGSLMERFDRPLRQALARRMDRPFWFDADRTPGYVEIEAPLREGGLLRIVAPRDRVFALRTYQFIVWLALFTVLLTSVALIFIRNQVRAIERLANAADAFGRGGDVPQFKPHGAREVRKAAFAFIAMKERLQRHIEQRTALLASVSHDLRTPLTRLKLEIALAEPSPRLVEMKQDIAEMEYMIEEYLAFARGEAGEAVELTPLDALLATVAAGASHTGAAVTIEVEPGLACRTRPLALKRAVTNLVMNAAAHGRRIGVAARTRPSGGIDIVVDDDGPGIAPERYEDAFKPFNRLDEARNQNEKGVGLGLAIARDAARAQGGDVILDKSPLGGLRAVVRLPG